MKQIQQKVDGQLTAWYSIGLIEHLIKDIEAIILWIIVKTLLTIEALEILDQIG